MRKKFISTMLSTMFLACVSSFSSCKSEKTTQVTEEEVVGTLTAYYANVDLDINGVNYKKGQLICDSNDPINRVVDLDGDNYKYEGDDSGEYYSWLFPKAKIEKKTYTMNTLSVDNVGQKAIFVSDKGCVARVFWSNINGHKYYNWDGSAENWNETERHEECYVLSVEFYSKWNGEKYLFEEPLVEKQGHIVLYRKNHYCKDNASPEDCRYREGPIGIIEEDWYNKEGWGYNKTAYTEDGKLLVDQWDYVDMPDYISIAYIADIDALYINGDLYYRN